MLSIKRWLFKKLYPQEWSAFNWEIDKELDLKEVTFVVFDTETTGLDLSEDEPIALGALKIRDFKIELRSKFYELIKPSKALRSSIKVHGITPSDLEKARSKREVLHDFVSYAKGSILCGFFVYIDFTMLYKIFKEEYKVPFCPPIVDIHYLLEDSNRSSNLEALVKRFGLPCSIHHNALEDAYMSALLFLKLLREGGFRKVKDLPLYKGIF
ncbi:MAG: 3'-5' exonuclease [Caldimicrobium sp.]|nr:3'-5' exonuclease [Caldimicrobium sp.]MCX7874524.1 3'-5' exonuclease [Caldimicrobium sp.]MDW8095030.1 3'-5' exonuclease [Caldimicrobium sp.]